MNIHHLSQEQVDKIVEHLEKDDYFVDMFGQSFKVSGMQSECTWGGGTSVEFDLYPCKKPSPPTEEEKQLKHINSLHQADIVHKQRMIAKNAELMKELQKKRGAA